MGFGILFFGYFISFLLSLNAYGSVFALIGNYVMFVAIQKLSEYKHSLMRTLPFLLLMAVCNLVKAAVELFSFELGTFQIIIETLSLLSILLFNIFLFLSIISLGNDTDVGEVKYFAKSNLAVISVYFAANVAMLLLKNEKAVVAAAMILRLVFPLFALALIYKCFRLICAPEDVDMPIKPSHFKFINEFRARQDKREEEARKAREEQLKKMQTAAKSKQHKKKK